MTKQLSLLFVAPVVSFLVCVTAFAAYPECPRADDIPGISQWRQAAVDEMYAGDFNYGSKAPDPNATVFFPNTPQGMLEHLEACFPRGVPACLKRFESSLEASSDSQVFIPPAEPSPKPRKPAVILPLDPVEHEEAMRTPPSEFFAPGSSANSGGDRSYVLFQLKKGSTPDKPVYETVEEVAARKGWPTVRYRSRQAGGFDEHTASLLMIRIPGDKQTPPVNYDQYINIGIPPDAPEVNAQHASDIPPVPTTQIPGPQAYAKEDDNVATDEDGNEITSVKYLPTVMTMVTVEKATDGRPAKVLFDKFDREDGTPNYTRTTNADTLQHCYSCHPNGLREISPLGYHVRPDDVMHGQVMPTKEWVAVQEMNNSMNVNQGFKPIDWSTFTGMDHKKHPAVDPLGYGPIYGSQRPIVKDVDPSTVKDFPTRSAAFILGNGAQPGCATMNQEIDVLDIFGRSPGKDNVYKLSPSPRISADKVAKAMNCAACHNNVVRGALNSQTDFTQIQFKVLVDQSMPLGAHRNPHDIRADNTAYPEDSLNPDERIALVNCLQAEFKLQQIQLPRWLTQNSCDKNQNLPDTTSVTNSESVPSIDFSLMSGLFNSVGIAAGQPAVTGVVHPQRAPANTAPVTPPSGTPAANTAQ